MTDAPRTWPVVAAIPERGMAMWRPSSFGGRVRISWASADHDAGRSVRFRHGGRELRTGGGSGGTEGWIWHVDAEGELIAAAPLEWLVDDEVVATVDLGDPPPPKGSLTAVVRGMPARADVPFGGDRSRIARLVDDLAGSHREGPAAPSSVHVIGATTTCDGALSFLSLERWPGRWSIAYEWRGDRSGLWGNTLSPLDGFVVARSATRQWDGHHGGVGATRDRTFGDLLFAGDLGDLPAELELAWSGADGSPRLTVAVAGL